MPRQHNVCGKVSVCKTTLGTREMLNQAGNHQSKEKKDVKATWHARCYKVTWCFIATGHTIKTIMLSLRNIQRLSLGTM